MLDVTQQEFARAVGISRSHIAGIETGRVDPSLDLVWAIADRLGLDLQFVARPPIAVDRRRGDLVHARCSGYADGRFRGTGWLTARELEATNGRFQRWIDILAFEPRSRTLIIVEIKTRLDDIGDIERQLGWYERNAIAVARSIGWQPTKAMSWLLLLASEEVDDQIAVNRQVLRRAFPDRAPVMRQILVAGAAPVARRGLALVDPTSRRKEWLISTRSDGRRSATPFRDYADAARRLLRVSLSHTRSCQTSVRHLPKRRESCRLSDSQ
jgi:transcriptional regulator with XRE-family HTH domain